MRTAWKRQSRRERSSRKKCLSSGEDAVAVVAAQELEGHGGGAFPAVFDTTGRAEAAFASERDKFHFSALGTGIHGPSKRRIAAVYHLFDVVHFNSSGMERILNYFVVVFKNLLQDVHEIIMQ